MLLFGAGTDYALLLVARYREQLRRQPDRHVAIAAALRGAAPAILASAATVSLGLLCLLVAEMDFNRTLGPVCAIAILCGRAAMLTLLPALLVVFGRWVFWPAVPRYDEAATDTALRVGPDRPRDRAPTTPGLGRARPLVLAALALGAVGIDTGLDDESMITGTPESLVGQRAARQPLPGGREPPDPRDHRRLRRCPHLVRAWRCPGRGPSAPGRALHRRPARRRRCRAQRSGRQQRGQDHRAAGPQRHARHSAGACPGRRQQRARPRSNHRAGP